MSLVPFRLTVPEGPCALAHLESVLEAWLEATHGADGILVRWAVVAGPESPDGAGWHVEGVAGKSARERVS